MWLVGVISAGQMGISRSLSLSLFSDLAALALVFALLLLGRNLVVELLECWLVKEVLVLLEGSSIMCAVMHLESLQQVSCQGD